MPITYPTTLDDFTNPTPADNLNTPAVLHSTQHANINDAVEALEAKVGVDNSAVTSSIDYKLAQKLQNPVDNIQFNTGATPITNAEGLLQWNATDGTLDLGMSSGAITMQIGQEMFIKVFNNTSGILLNGLAVYFSGTNGTYPTIDYASGT